MEMVGRELHMCTVLPYHLTAFTAGNYVNANIQFGLFGSLNFRESNLIPEFTSCFSPF